MVNLSDYSLKALIIFFTLLCVLLCSLLIVLTAYGTMDLLIYFYQYIASFFLGERAGIEFTVMILYCLTLAGIVCGIVKPLASNIAETMDDEIRRTKFEDHNGRQRIYEAKLTLDQYGLNGYIVSLVIDADKQKDKFKFKIKALFLSQFVFIFIVFSSVGYISN